MTRILIVDDHAVVRLGLREILAEAFPQCQFGEAANAGDALELVMESAWNVAVLDVNMPGRNGLELLKDVKRIRPDLPVLVLSVHPEDQYAMRTLRAGAAGYMTKESAPEELVGAVKAVVAGRRYISPYVAERLARDLGRRGDAASHESLSDREYEVMSEIEEAAE